MLFNEFPRAVFLDLATIDTGDLDISCLQALPLAWKFHAGTTKNELQARLQDAEILVSNKVVLDARALQQPQGIKHIFVAATGTDNIDLQAAESLGISVSNVTAYATPAVIQHVFSLILALSTRLLDYHNAVRQGHWQRSDQFCLLDFPISEIAGKHLGIVGYGELGSGVAKIARAFGMKVSIAQRPGGTESRTDDGRLPLDELLPDLDILTLHCPLTKATRNLIGARQLAMMKPHALLINTARGGIVDEGALASALLAGHLGGAGIDVLANEPPINGSPLLEAGIPRLILTPHTAWASREARQRLLEELAENINAALQGRRRNPVI